MSIEYPAQVVDLHTHLFNARYVPLEGILRKKGMPSWLASLASRLINRLTGKTEYSEKRGGEPFEVIVTESDDFDVIAEALADIAARELALGFESKGWPAVMEARGPQDAAKWQAEFRFDPLYAVLEDLEQAYEAGIAGEKGERPTSAFAEMLSAFDGARGAKGVRRSEGIRKGIFGRFFAPIRWLIEKMVEFIVEDAYGTALDYVKFVLLMLSSEQVLLRRLFSGYRVEQNVSLAVHLMMDMEPAYADGAPHYAYEKQVRRMEYLVENAGGRLVGFVAFDPRRDGGLAIVKDAMSRGNCGVKVYPPMGYKAVGDDAIQKLRFHELYTWCCDNGVPVLTHCTAEGFEAYEGSGVLSDPDHWQEVLADFPDLRLCYGHAGGGGTKKSAPQNKEKIRYPGWCDPEQDWEHERNYAAKVVRHCRGYVNVYCDFSHLHEILDDDTKARQFRRNLVNAYQAGDGRYAFADKAMYGSDWHMPRMARHAGHYLDCMLALFDGEEALCPHKEKFFSLNALNFLNLEQTVEHHRIVSSGRLSSRTLDSLEAGRVA